MTISSELTPSTTTTRSVKDHEGPSNNDNDHMPTLSTPTPPHFNQPQATQCVKMAMAAAAVAVSRHDTFGATGIFFSLFSLSSFFILHSGCFVSSKRLQVLPSLTFLTTPTILWLLCMNKRWNLQYFYSRDAKRHFEFKHQHQHHCQWM